MHFIPQKVKHLYIEETKKKPDINHEYIVTEKRDGWFTYCSFSKKEGWDFVRSATGRIIPSMKFCKDDFFNKLPNPPCNTIFIMEAYIPDTSFHILNGIFNRSKGNCSANDVHFEIHDVLLNSRPKDSNLQRHLYLIKLLDQGYFNKTSRLTPMSILSVTSSKKDWFRIFDIITESDGEGIVLKRADGFFQPGKRNSSLMKIKLEDTFDLLCIDMYETVGEKGNRNLNLKLKRKSGVEVDVRVGKHEDIANFLSDPTLAIGKVVEVRCMKEIEKGGALREPRFVTVRLDKTREEID